jgi:hypothetical protein
VITVFLKEGGEGATYAVPVADKVMRAYLELTEKRARGTMLREDKQPIGRDTPAPEPAQETVTEGADAETAEG